VDNTTLQTHHHANAQQLKGLQHVIAVWLKPNLLQIHTDHNAIWCQWTQYAHVLTNPITHHQRQHTNSAIAKHQCQWILQQLSIQLRLNNQIHALASMLHLETLHINNVNAVSMHHFHNHQRIKDVIWLFKLKLHANAQMLQTPHQKHGTTIVHHAHTLMELLITKLVENLTTLAHNVVVSIKQLDLLHSWTVHAAWLENHTHQLSLMTKLVMQRTINQEWTLLWIQLAASTNTST